MLLEATEFMNPYIGRRGKWCELFKEDGGWWHQPKKKKGAEEEFDSEKFVLSQMNLNKPWKWKKQYF